MGPLFFQNQEWQVVSWSYGLPWTLPITLSAWKKASRFKDQTYKTRAGHGAHPSQIL